MLIEKISTGLGLPETYVESIARGASHEYKPYTIAKRSGGTRTIHHPSRRLKGLQRWLLHNVINYWPVHSAATAYRQGVSIMDNATVHAGSSYLLRMDLENFFPSIRESDIRNYIIQNATDFSDWQTADIELLTNIVCRFGALTIGAPTSPSTANALCHDLDKALHSAAINHDLSYTRYADDLFFSALRPAVLSDIEAIVQETVSSLSVPAGLKVNAKKTWHSSKKGVRRVTGIVLGSDGKPYVGRALKRKIRALVYRTDTLSPPEKASLAGLIAYVVGFDPQFSNSLQKYGLKKVTAARKGGA